MPRKRRGAGEGSIRPRKGGGYEARLTLADGSRPSLYGATYEEARRKLAAAIRERDEGVLQLGDARQTVGRYLTSWLQVDRATVSEGSYEQHESRVRVHITPAIGRVRLVELTPQHVQHMMAGMLNQGLAPNTVRAVRSTLHKALQDALAQGIVSRNVVELARPPRARRAEMRVYDEQQTQRLLRVAAEASTRAEALLTLAVTTGMREGELLSLTWRNVSLDGRYLHVQTNLRRLRNRRHIVKDVKTEHGRRKIELSDRAVDALRRHRVKQHAERLAMGATWEDRDLVFPNTRGRHATHSSTLERLFHPLARQAGLPLIHFHDLRHTAATLLLLKGVHPKKVSEMLGHASITITLALYSHVLPSMHRDAATAMDELFPIGVYEGVKTPSSGV